MGITIYTVELGLTGRTTGIFWDYENVPLRHTDWEAFLEGITHYVNRNPIAFARIYGRESTMSDQDYVVWNIHFKNKKKSIRSNERGLIEE